MSHIDEELNNQINPDHLALDQLVRETLADLHLFKNQQLQMKSQIHALLEDNVKTCSTSEIRCDYSKHSQITNEALLNTRKQLDIILQDKQDLVSINENSYRTIKNLEKEVDNYRKLVKNMDKGNEHKSKFDNAIRLLESKVSEQRSQLEDQSTLIKVLHSHKIRDSETIAKLQAKINDEHNNEANVQLKDSTIKKLEQELESALKKNEEYEKTLNSKNELLEEASKREMVAMEKVQESLVVAETAMQEKREAENRAQAYKEECAQLAVNIGTIMDQAAQKVDGEVMQLQVKLEKKEESFNELQKQLLKEQEEFKKRIMQMEVEQHKLKQKCRDILIENDKLRDEAQLAREQVKSLKVKLNENENNILADRCEEIKKQCDAQLETFSSANERLKERYHSALDDLTAKFEAEMLGLKKENAELRANFQYMQSAKLAKAVTQSEEKSNEVAKK